MDSLELTLEIFANFRCREAIRACCQKVIFDELSCWFRDSYFARQYNFALGNLLEKSNCRVFNKREVRVDENVENDAECPYVCRL
jgi:hypothetical protein